MIGVSPNSIKTKYCADQHSWGGKTMDSYLNNLVGRWNLRGTMGDKILHQRVTGRWVLDNLFLELRFKSIQIERKGNPRMKQSISLAETRKLGIMF